MMPRALYLSVFVGLTAGPILAGPPDPFPCIGNGTSVGPSGDEFSGAVWHPHLHVLFVVDDEGAVYRSDPDGTFEGPWTHVYDEYDNNDLEAICVADPLSDFIYIGVESDHNAGDRILEVRADTGERVRSFHLEPHMPASDNDGLEALTFVPDVSSPEGGYFYAARQADDTIYIFELPLVSNPSSEEVQYIGNILLDERLTGLDYHRQSDTLYGIFGDIDVLRAMDVDTTQHTLTVTAEWTLPPGNKQEGVAFTGCDLFIAEDGGRVWKYLFVPGAGEYSCDGLLTLPTFATFPDCMGGPGALPIPTGPITIGGCLCLFDFDLDEDVDLLDFGEFSTSAALPQMVYVDGNATDPNDGTSWCSAYTQLSEALISAAAGTTIRVADGTYTPDTTGLTDPREATFQLTRHVAIEGGYAGCGAVNPDERDISFYETILSGDINGDDATSGDNSENSYHVVTGSDADATTVLDGFTVTHGNANGSHPNGRGGGMYNAYASPTISNCTFESNAASYGGGVYNAGGKPMVINCIFRDNSATWEGSGVHNAASSALVSKCIFTGNNGSAMYNKGGSPSAPSPTVTNSFLRGNHGSGMYNHDHGDAMVANCVFSGNTAGLGGGMRNEQSDPTLVNCTFSGNTASGSGGGIYDSPTFYGHNLTNCVFWGNSDVGGTDESAQIHTSSDGTIINYSCIQGWSGSLGGLGNIGTDPLFADADGSDDVAGTMDDDLRLRQHSPCVDAGDNMAVPADLTDLDGDGDVRERTPVDVAGASRFLDDPATVDTGIPDPPDYLCIVDMGAYERVGLLVSDIAVTVPEGGTAVLTVALAQDPFETIEVTVAHHSGDPDITVQSGGSLIFNSANYTDPQPVTLTAAADEDEQNGTALIAASAPGYVTETVTARELDSEAPTIVYVDADAVGANDGRTWERAFTNLQDALTLAATTPEVKQIHVAQGVYTPAGPLGDRAATFQLINGVALMGGYAGFGEPDPDARDNHSYQTILSGDLNGDDDLDFVNNNENSYHVVTGSDTDATSILDGFTITAGNANGSLVESRGGGLYNSVGNPTLIDCAFSGNAASEDGGGMYNAAGSNPTLTNCTFSRNSASLGGAMYNDQASPALTNCAFSGNAASQDGAGMYNAAGSNPTLANCAFSGNSAADGHGGGIYCFPFATIPSLFNCILWGNVDSNGMGESAQVRYLAALPHVDYSCIQGWTGTLGGAGNIGEDPMFVDADGPDDVPGTEDDNLRLLAGSPCIDAGDNAAVTVDLFDLDGDGDIDEPIPFDLDGNPRFADDPETPDTGNGAPPIIDMGPYERVNQGLLWHSKVITVPQNSSRPSRATEMKPDRYSPTADRDTFWGHCCLRTPALEQATGLPGRGLGPHEGRISEERE